MHAKKKAQLLAATLVAPGLFIAGCSGGGGNLSPFNPTPTSGPGTATPTATSGGGGNNLIGLTTNGRLFTFNSQSPGRATTLTVSGVSGQLLGIDYRFVPDAAGTQALYGLAGSGSSYQLYRFDIAGTTATATAVGSAFTADLGTDIGFDFNPNVPSPTDATVRVDRIRVVSSNRTNLRLVPNTGAVADNDPNTAGTQLDGTLTYAQGDPNVNATPRVIGSAYTNNDTDLATGTVIYGIDIATGFLVTQGRSAGAGGTPAAVSPNTGQLFSVGRLGVNLVNNLGFDIAPTSNTAYVASGSRLFTVNLGTGAATSLGTIAVPSGTTLRGVAVLP